jgi:hypothetical protein
MTTKLTCLVLVCGIFACRFANAQSKVDSLLAARPTQTDSRLERATESLLLVLG